MKNPIKTIKKKYTYHRRKHDLKIYFINFRVLCNLIITNTFNKNNIYRVRNLRRNYF